MNFNITVEDKIFEDLLITALEGGSNYWYYLPEEFNVPEGECLSTWMFKEVMTNSLQVSVCDLEDSEEEDPNILGYLTKENIIKGTQLMIFKSPEHFFDLLNDNMDATTADVWFQYVVLGEIVYG